MKTPTRQKRTSNKSTHCHIHDKAVITHISLKDWLADVRTKSELVNYLGNKSYEHNVSPQNKLNIFLVSFDNKTLGNVFVPLTLQSHNHEVADTLMILHALTIPKDARLDVKSPDTDVFFLLVHIYSKLPAKTSFVVGDGSLQKKRSFGEFYSVLGENYARTLLGFHAFTGSDMTGKFAGRSKKACLKVFL